MHFYGSWARITVDEAVYWQILEYFDLSKSGKRLTFLNEICIGISLIFFVIPFDNDALQYTI